MNVPGHISLLVGIAGCLAVACSHRTEVAVDSGPDAKPSEWILDQRTFPHGNWDRSAIRDALEEARGIKRHSKRGTSLGQWQLAGPVNIGGRVTDVEFDPLSPHIVYAGAATGGVFKSEDTGESWFPIFDEQAVLTVGDIAVDPNNPEIVYVGTGEANPSNLNLAGGGIYKSTDGGASWSFIGLDETVSTARILIDPFNSDRLFVAAAGSYFVNQGDQISPDRGVYRSMDGGLSWDNVHWISDSTGAIDLVMHPNDPNNLFVAMWERARRPTGSHLAGPTSGVYRTLDGGDTWEELGPDRGLPDPKSTSIGRIGLTISRNHPNVLYALFTDGVAYHGLFKTSDGGNTWLNADPLERVRQGTGGFSWFFGQVRVSPVDTNRVYALDVDFMRSDDGGRQWAITPRNTFLHVDHHALAFHPNNPEFIIDGNDGGINISENGGRSWRKIRTLPITQFYEVAIDPTFPERLWGGTQDNGTLRTPTGSTSDWNMPLSGDGFYVSIAPEALVTSVYAERQFGDLHKSIDDGGRWSAIATSAFGIPPRWVGESSSPEAEPRNWSTPVVVDPSDPAVIYYGTNRVYCSETRGASWRPISPSLTDFSGTTRFGTISTIAVSPTNSDVIYVGTDDGHVWVTPDRGDSWRDVSSALPYRWVTRVAVDPVDPSVAYATFSGLKWKDPVPHVFRTDDMGESWVDLNAGLPDAPANAFAIDPVDPDVLYLGTDVGAFVSIDRGANWEALGDGLPAVSVFDLKVHAGPDAHFVIAGTHGRSMYRLDLLNVVTAAETEPPNLPGPPLDLDVYPNPFATRTSIQVGLESGSNVTIEVFDAAGRRVARLLDRALSAGTQVIAWDAVGLTPGAYVIRLSSGANQSVTRLVTKLSDI